jgi:hypothetical protein
MPSRRPSVLRDGVIAGLIGASVVAVWFLVIDTLRGRPFLTPALLGSAVFYGATSPEGLHISPGPILGYTLLHGLAFVAFGIIAAGLIVATEREPGLFIAFVILFGSFEAFFFGAAAALGQSVIGALVWWTILVGNLLASVAMLWYFFSGRAGIANALVGAAGTVLREGIVAGLIGAGVVAVWFLVIDFAQGEPLRTPSLLGSALLGRPGGAPAIMLYTLLHGVAFVVIGLVAAVLVAAADRQPMFTLALIIFFTSFEVFFFGAVVILAKWVLDEIAGWTIFVGNLLAAAAMLGYFIRGHPGLTRSLASTWAEEDVESEAAPDPSSPEARR